jgi:hypothetical protein
VHHPLSQPLGTVSSIPVHITTRHVTSQHLMSRPAPPPLLLLQRSQVPAWAPATSSVSGGAAAAGSGGGMLRWPVLLLGGVPLDPDRALPAVHRPSLTLKVRRYTQSWVGAAGFLLRQCSKHTHAAAQHQAPPTCWVCATSCLANADASDLLPRVCFAPSPLCAGVSPQG